MRDAGLVYAFRDCDVTGAESAWKKSQPFRIDRAEIGRRRQGIA